MLPVASSTMALASLFKSLGFLLDRFGIPGLYHKPPAVARANRFQTDPLPGDEGEARPLP